MFSWSICQRTVFASQNVLLQIVIFLNQLSKILACSCQKKVDIREPYAGDNENGCLNKEHRTGKRFQGGGVDECEERRRK